MPQPIHKFPKPKVMSLKWGKGRTKAVVYGKYRRGKSWSYAIKRLDIKRHATKDFSKGHKVHKRYPHTTDLPMAKW